MSAILSNPIIQDQLNQYSNVPETAIRKAPTVISKTEQNNDSTPSLLSAAGWSAGTTAAFQTGKVWANREKAHIANARKGVKELSRIGSHAKALRNLASGSLLGAAVSAPMDYLSSKEYEKYKNDQNFNAGHLAAIAAPAAASATLGTGALMHTMKSLKDSGKTGTTQMLKDIVSPSKIWKSTKNELSNIKNITKRGKIGSGLLAAGFMATSALEPLQYYMNTHKKKNVKKDNLEKKASINPAKSEKLKAYLAKSKMLGAGVAATGAYFGVKGFINDRRQKINDLYGQNLSTRGIRKEISGEAGLYS